MIRQAHTYLVGAMSGATLIAIAIAAFVLLVSAQVFRDWPIAALGSGDEGASVSSAQPAGATPAAAQGPAAAPGAGAATTAGGGGTGKSAGGGSTPTATAEAPAGGGESGGGGGPGGSGTGGPASPAPSTAGTSAGGGAGSTSTSTSGKVAETVNGTVTHVDETATGGALNEAGVTPVTEGVVNGVAGPESPVGKVVDETAGAGGGVLPGTR
jgi:hypothetical protein